MGEFAKALKEVSSPSIAATTIIACVDTQASRLSCLVFQDPKARARPEKAESGGDSQAGRIMIHHTGWEEARMDGKTLFAGFTGTHGTGGSCRTVPAHVRCQRELHDQADAAGGCNKQ